MQTRTPHKLKPSILNFCNSIVPNQTPFYVQIEPMPQAKFNECFFIVPEHIIRHGGKQIFGWTIWEWPKIMVEAEFHTIWSTDDGRFIDITPKQFNVTQILFLPDPCRKYEGRQINNIRKPLTGDKRVHRFCQLADELFIATNEGDLAYKDEVPLTPRIQEIQNQMAQLYLTLTRKYG